jgi:hypothetical protein
MNQLKKTSEDLQVRSAKMALSLIKVNQIVSFDISEKKLLAWAETIKEIEPWAEKEDIDQVFLMIFKGMLDFDSNKGILNILEGLRRVNKEKIRLKALEDNEW